MHTPHFGLRCVKVAALRVIDAARAHDFYGHTLGLEPAFEREQQIGYRLGDSVLMLKDEGSIPPQTVPIRGSRWKPRTPGRPRPSCAPAMCGLPTRSSPMTAISSVPSWTTKATSCGPARTAEVRRRPRGTLA